MFPTTHTALHIFPHCWFGLAKSSMLMVAFMSCSTVMYDTFDMLQYCLLCLALTDIHACNACCPKCCRDQHGDALSGKRLGQQPLPLSCISAICSTDSMTSNSSHTIRTCFWQFSIQRFQRSLTEQCAMAHRCKHAKMLMYLHGQSKATTICYTKVQAVY